MPRQAQRNKRRCGSGWGTSFVPRKHPARIWQRLEDSRNPLPDKTWRSWLTKSITRAIALFYTVAGQSLQHFRTLGSQERQSRLEALFSATNDYLLKEWNAESAFEQALHPQKLLERWLGYRLKPDGQIGTFLKDTFLVDPDTEGFLIQGKSFPIH